MRTCWSLEEIFTVDGCESCEMSLNDTMFSTVICKVMGSPI